MPRTAEEEKRDRDHLVFMNDALDAESKFTVEVDDTNGPVRFISAGVGNGTRIEVVRSVLPPAARPNLGANALITVVWPWPMCYPMQYDPGLDLHLNYVRMRLVPQSEKTPNGGDVAGITLAVALTLDRTSVIS